MVLASSAQYRADQDYLGEYVKDQIVENPVKTILVSDLKRQFKAWYESHYDKKTITKLKEIENYVTKKYGKPKEIPRNGMALDTILRILKPYPNKLLQIHIHIFG